MALGILNLKTIRGFIVIFLIIWIFSGKALVVVKKLLGSLGDRI